MYLIADLFRKYFLNMLGVKQTRLPFQFLIKLLVIFIKKSRKPGFVFDGKWEIEYTDGLSFFYGYSEIFFNHIYDLGPYQKQKLKILDIGSNIGLSILYLKEKYPDAEITGMEPDPLIYKVLQKNLKANHIQDVTILNKAAWYEDGTLSFNSDGSDGGHIGTVGNNSIQVDCINIKNVFNQAYDFLKIDIEGAELKLFSYLQDQIINIPKVFLEYHSLKKEKDNLGEIINHFTNHGYDFSIVSLKNNWSPFVTTLEGPFNGQYNLWFKKKI